MKNLNEIKVICERYGAEFLNSVPVAPYTTFKIGGNCNIVKVNCDDVLLEVLGYCSRYNVPRYILGNGSNVLVSDAGLPGVVLLLGSDYAGINVSGEYINCQAGAKLSDVCKAALEHSLTGLEFAYGIPASAGGAVYMNAGAYGGEMKDVVRSALCHGQEGNLIFEKTHLEFSYRHSIFRDCNHVITGVVFKLNKGLRSEIKAKMDDIMHRRREKQPLEFPSAGSTFKRPEGDYASRLIDVCGLKGFTVGGAMVSEKHAGFVINKGNATCKDVLELIEAVKERVYKETGIMLEREVEVLN
jgi:UDP-N-acetylmuramate dehydrogenase